MNARAYKNKVRHGVGFAKIIATSLAITHFSTQAASAQEQSAAAEQPSSSGINDIVVTATRQSTSAQNVPISLTAVGSEQLAQQGVTSAAQLDQVAPSLFINSEVSAGSIRFSLRGISNNDTLPAASSAVATYIDDVYQAVIFGTAASIFDVQRIEVLRGPQGTTFGRNTTGGAIAYFSQVPTNHVEGYVTGRVAGGDRPERFLEAAVNVPIVDDVLAIRLSGRVDSKSSYMSDINSGVERGANELQSGRFQVRWTPSDHTTVNLTVFGARMRGDAPLAHAVITPDNPFSFVGFPAQNLGRNNISLTDDPYYDNFDNTGVTLRIEHALGDLFNLTSISHYRRTKFGNRQDLDGTPADLLYYTTASNSSQWGQELRLASDPSRRISGIFGLYYEKDKLNELTTESATRGELDYFGFPVEYNNRARYITQTEAYAAFLNITVKPIEAVSIIGGIRKSREIRTQHGRKDFFQPVDPTNVFDWTPGNILTANPTPTDTLDYVNRLEVEPWSWDVTFNYNPHPGFLVFARMAKGYRSGGFNPALTQFFPRVFGEPAPSVPLPYGAEEVQSYELGVKLDLLDRKLRLNGSIYHYDYNDQQVTTYPAGVPTTTNAGKSKIDGGEIELTAFPIDNLELRGSLSYTDAKYDEFLDESTGANFAGNQVIQAPKWTATWSANYTIPVSATYEVAANTSWNYRSEVFNTPDNAANFRAAPVTIGNIRFTLKPSDEKGFSVAAFVNNVTDKRPLASGFSFGPGFDIYYYGVGRIYGLDATFRW